MGFHSQNKPVITFLFLCLFSLFYSCGEFIGFSPVPRRTIENIESVDFYLSGNNLLKLYESVLESTYIPCVYETDNSRVGGYIKVMGSFSRLYPKKSFIVKLNTTPHCYAFEAAYDYFITNRIALYAYSRAGLFSPGTEGVAFYMNNSYIGCYTRIKMYEQEELYDRYYKKSGELFKAYFNDLGNDIPLYYRTEKKFPDNNDFTTVNTFIYNAKHMDDHSWSEWVNNYIDKEEMIKYLAVHNYLKVKDTKLFNFYIYNYGKILFLPWDNEISMDLTSSTELDGNNLLTKRLLSEPSIRAGYNTAMRRLFLVAQSDIQPFLNVDNPETTENIIDDCINEVNRICPEIDRAVYYESGTHVAYEDFIDEKNMVLSFLLNRSYTIPDPVLTSFIKTN